MTMFDSVVNSGKHITLVLPDNTPLYPADQEGYDFFRNNAAINPSLHQHWHGLVRQAEAAGGRFTITMVLPKPEPPVLRFYTKLFAILEEEGMTITIISKAIADKICSISTPLLLTGEEALSLDEHFALTGAQTKASPIQKLLARARSAKAVLSCR